MTLRLTLCVLLAGCAAGPRPVPATASPAERVAIAEAAIATLATGTVSFVVEAKGALTMQLIGSVDLRGKEGLFMSADGQLGNDGVRLEVEARADGLSRSLTKGPSVSNHLEPMPARLREAFARTLVRQGLFPSLMRLSNDEPFEFEAAEVSATRHEAESTSKPEIPCQPVDAKAGTTTAVLCIADATALLVDRTGTVRLSAGEVTVSERYQWKVAAK